MATKKTMNYTVTVAIGSSGQETFELTGADAISVLADVRAGGLVKIPDTESEGCYTLVPYHSIYRVYVCEEMTSEEVEDDTCVEE